MGLTGFELSHFCAERLFIHACEEPLHEKMVSRRTWCRCCPPHQNASRRLSPNSESLLLHAKDDPVTLFANLPHAAQGSADVSDLPSSPCVFTFFSHHVEAFFSEVG